jgi:hypothetical protein
MSRLHQLLPLRKTIQETTAKALAEARTGLSRRDWLEGLSRTYAPKDDEGDRLPAETKLAQLSAADVMALVGENLARLLDITATTEYANTEAKADVKIDGQVLVPEAPVSYLLFLEKQIAEWERFVAALPTLDPAVHWTRDETTAGMWRSDPEQTVRNKKTTKPVVLYPATDKHPAQVKEVSEDVMVGTWTAVKFSGAFPAAAVREVQERLVKLRLAVLHAREEANSVEARDQNVGHAVTGFVFSPLL